MNVSEAAPPLSIFTYNIHSLIDFDNRMQCIVTEFENIHWDLLIFTETWREEKSEAWQTQDGHSWFGSGGSKRSKGVGFLLHSRWSHKSFNPVSERLATLDIQFAKHHDFRFIAVYMPHGGHDDLDVEAVYYQIAAETREARRKDSRIIIAGDFNAEIGPRADHDDAGIIGDNPATSRDARGELLLKWCTFLQTIVANSFGVGCWNDAWTYRNGSRLAQLDYFLVDSRLAGAITKCHVLPEVDTGSDHRGVMLKMQLAQFSSKKRRRSTNYRPKRFDDQYTARLEQILQMYPYDTESAAEKVSFLNAAFLDAASATVPEKDCHTMGRLETAGRKDETEIHELVRQRRLLSSSGLPTSERSAAKRIIGKQLQSAIRKKKQDDTSRKMEEILTEFHGLSRLTALTGQNRKKLMVEVQGADGTMHREKEGIAEVFAKFYEHLYSTTCGADPEKVYCAEGHDVIDPFTMEELQKAIRETRPARSGDKQGITAEMFKVECPRLRQLMLDAFNHVIQPNEEAPLDWLQARISVIYKKGEATLPANYRPIAILSLLYKLFSRMLCGRLRGTLDRQQSIDQAAYRKGFSTEDHLLTLTLLLEASSEWNAEVWLGLIDFEKAFDTIEHEPLWKALAEQGVEKQYINILKQIYRHQTATVKAGVESREFSITRGVRQGDPISSLLFTAVMESIFRSLKQRWRHLNSRRSGTYYGVVIDDPADPLTNLLFADDVVLVATCQKDISKMIVDLDKNAAKFGLKIHMGKTAVLTNASRSRPNTIKCGQAVVKVLLQDDAEKYLGRKISIDLFHETEIANRIAAGWCAFWKLKDVLCNRRLSLKDRFRLFESCVSPGVLYACGTWTLTVDLSLQIQAAQRKMLRWLVGLRRETEEPWIDFIKRSTHISERLAREHGVPDWLDTHRLRKWKLAGTVARRTDNRWSKRLLGWKPHFRTIPYRDVGRPCLRWSDAIADVAGGDWAKAAADEGLWMALSYAFRRQLE